jgi:hypothetical protein
MLLGEQRGIDEISVSLEARYPSEEEQAETEGRTVFDYLPLRIWVALATFIPTFLAVFIGLPQLLTSAPARHATQPRAPEALSATMSLTGLSTPTGWPADLRPGYLGPSVSSGPAEWGRPTTLVGEAPTPRPSPEATELAASRKPTVFGPKVPKPAAAEDSAWAPAAAFADNQTGLGSRARCAAKDTAWTCVMKTLPRGHG